MKTNLLGLVVVILLSLLVESSVLLHQRLGGFSGGCHGIHFISNRLWWGLLHWFSLLSYLVVGLWLLVLSRWGSLLALSRCLVGALCLVLVSSRLVWSCLLVLGRLLVRTRLLILVGSLILGCLSWLFSRLVLQRKNEFILVTNNCISL